MNSGFKMLKFVGLVSFVLSIFTVFSQEESKLPELKFYFSEDKTSYAGMKMAGQFWARYNMNNPDIDGTEQYGDFDLGIRRSRLFFYTSLMDRVFLYAQIGADDITYLEKQSPSLKLYDAEAEFIIKKDVVHFGLGLNSWNGISRYSNSDFTQYLVVDHPGFSYPVEDTFDKGGSQLGVYARGTIGKLAYRVSVAKPFEWGIDSVSSPVTTERTNENFAFKGYFDWQFFDKENSQFPYMTMNNLGRGKILNVGTGFYYHPEAMLVEADKDLSTVDEYIVMWLIAHGQSDLIPNFADYYPSQISDIFIASADVFFDMPTKRGGAITSYLEYSYNFFGPNYIRSMSTMNVSKMSENDALPQGPGTSQWEVGTGHIVRGEFGYMFPGKSLKNRLQPYGAFTFKKFEALEDASFQFDAGLNWLMYGNNIKWTLQYSSRPIYTESSGAQFWTDSKGQFILQAQICF